MSFFKIRLWTTVCWHVSCCIIIVSVSKKFKGIEKFGLRRKNCWKPSDVSKKNSRKGKIYSNKYSCGCVKSKLFPESYSSRGRENKKSDPKLFSHRSLKLWLRMVWWMNEAGIQIFSPLCCCHPCCGHLCLSLCFPSSHCSPSSLSLALCPSRFVSLGSVHLSDFPLWCTGQCPPLFLLEQIKKNNLKLWYKNTIPILVNLTFHKSCSISRYHPSSVSVQDFKLDNWQILQKHGPFMP